MITEWTEADIEAVLMQLDEQGLPFEKYCFTADGDGLVLLGKGGFANVYEGHKRGAERKKFAIKVLGFKDKRLDPESARTAAMLQKEAARNRNHIVKVFEFSEVRVWIDGSNTVVRAKAVGGEEDRKMEDADEDGFLTLQFVLMEKLTPVLEKEKNGKILLHPYTLGKFYERQIFNLVYDISIALEEIHEKKFLHRDIKLENIFYSEKDGVFKLGDFGVSIKTYDGMASTIAFTSGYGAPEVRSVQDDKYDNTADIYSLGMVLYVLLNHMKFPGSETYQPNVPLQYTRGNELPKPASGSGRLKSLAVKMISYDPDDRPQSVDEVLTELGASREGGLYKYRMEHKTTSAVLAMCFAAAGAAAWRLSGWGWFTESQSVPEYIFMGLCVAKGIRKAWNKGSFLISLGILGLGLYLTISQGMPWYCILGVVCLATVLDVTTGVAGVLMAAANLPLILSSLYPELNAFRIDAGWAAILFISLAAAFSMHYLYMRIRKRDSSIVELMSKRYWGVLAFLYGGMWLDMTMSYSNRLTAAFLKYAIGETAYEFLKLHSAEKALMAGALFCLFWIARGIVISFFISISDRIHQKK